MTIRVKKMHQQPVSHDELTSLLALTLLCEDLNDQEPESPRQGARWLRWGNAITAGRKKDSPRSIAN